MKFFTTLRTKRLTYVLVSPDGSRQHGSLLIASVAQSVEQRTENPRVGSSILP
ncbi:hypothetical protein KL86SPO_30172 [uncultured Sporomusa sp.]|uniref:Uncharacterized protein n=1 Tax=uncultured Sporomusa sp. TaxID=307249 RepID=A0A212LR73_9FIRM|nr:hypothetical protein KL86SPO_30172 [uncultured Sporomusa sp.]